jgi:hypothetical protein
MPPAVKRELDIGRFDTPWLARQKLQVRLQIRHSRNRTVAIEMRCYRQPVK